MNIRAHKIDDHDLVALWIDKYPMGCSVQLTVEQARAIADELIEACRVIEAREEVSHE